MPRSLNLLCGGSQQLDGLTVDYARQSGSAVILRGLRAMTDFGVRTADRPHESEAWRRKSEGRFFLAHCSPPQLSGVQAECALKEVAVSGALPSGLWGVTHEGAPAVGAEVISPQCSLSSGANSLHSHRFFPWLKPRIQACMINSINSRRSCLRGSRIFLSAGRSGQMSRTPSSDVIARSLREPDAISVPLTQAEERVCLKGSVWKASCQNPTGRARGTPLPGPDMVNPRDAS